ncbi:MAG: hypothetical protein U1E39_14735 [Planctomycetota bacterium]
MTPPTDPAPTAVPAPAPERRRGPDRRGEDRRKQQVPVAVERRSGLDRRALPDRRAMEGKTAGSYDLDAETMEFILAVNQFKAATGKPFPTWSEILQIVRSLGYTRPPR